MTVPNLTKRDILLAGGLAAVVSGSPAVAARFKPSVPGRKKHRIIAVEEAFQTAEFQDELRRRRGGDLLGGNARLYSNDAIYARLVDLPARIADMDANGVDMHLLSLGAPGVQEMGVEAGVRFARSTNDWLAATAQRYPRRFAGLAAVPTQDPAAAAKEIERAMTELRLNGVLINSHTEGHWLDEDQFKPVLEAAVRFNAPIYLHPTTPPASMIEPLRRYGMDKSQWGFGAECGLHAVRLLLSGIFDQYPSLQIVLGHMGEGLPFWLYRLDHRYEVGLQFDPKRQLLRSLRRKPSDYFRSNFHICTSGIFDDGPLNYAFQQLGVDKVLFAIDYPFEDTKPAVDWITKMALTEDQRAKVLHENAERVFRIPA